MIKLNYQLIKNVNLKGLDFYLLFTCLACMVKPEITSKLHKVKLLSSLCSLLVLSSACRTTSCWFEFK